MVDKLVEFETACLSKQKGFDELCRWGYTNLEDGHPKKGEIRDFSDAYTIQPLEKNSDLSSQVMTAPSQSLLQKWLRENHNIEVGVLRYTYSGGVYQGRKYMFFVNQYDPKYNEELAANDAYWLLNETKSNGYDFTNYEAALEVALKTALYLI